MESSQLQILDDLEMDINSFVSDFDKALPGANDEIYEELNNFLGELKKRGSGSIAASVENLKAIDKYRKTLDRIIAESSYSETAIAFLSKFSATTKYIDKYFSTMVVSFSNNNELYKAILKSNVNSASQLLLGSGIDANFKEPIIKILKDQVVSGSDTKLARKTLKDFIVGSKDVSPKLSRYVNQVANDTIRTFSRSYTKAISDDLNLKHWYYRGTKINDSRSFCTARAGKYFTDVEVRAWAKLDWSGKNPATTADTIQIFVGGYSCRHNLLPVTKELYDKVKGN